MEQQERNIQPISSQEHRDALPPMFSREINWSEGFPNMVLSTEYSKAVNARYTFQPLWVSDITYELQYVVLWDISCGYTSHFALGEVAFSHGEAIFYV